MHMLMNNETNIKVLKGQFFILAVILTGKNMYIPGLQNTENPESAMKLH